MSFFKSDLASLQNAALCGTLLWRFSAGYEKEASANRDLPLPLAFVVLPVVLNPIARGVLQSTQVDRGLIAFVAKFSTPPARIAHSLVEGVDVRRGKENLLALQGRILSFRTLTLQSIAMAVSAGLVRVKVASASVEAVSDKAEPRNVSPEIREMLRTSYKFGQMAGPYMLPEICRIMGIVL